MARDGKVYGFRKPRAEALLALPLNEEREFPEMRPRPRRVAGGFSGIRYVRFKLLQNFIMGSTNADFFEMDSTPIEPLSTEGPDKLLDPEYVAEELQEGDTGYAIYQAGAYYFVQARCHVPEE